MSVIRKVFKNTAYLTIGQIFYLGLGMVWMALFSRYIGPEGLGKYTFAQSTVSILALFIELGLQTLIIRNVSREKGEAHLYFNNVIFIKIILSSIIYFSFLLYIYSMGWDELIFGLFLAVIINNILYSINLVSIAIFYAFEKMKYDALGQIIYSIVLVFGVFIGIKLKLKLTEIVYIIAFSSAVRLILNMSQIYNHKEFNVTINFRFLNYNFIRKIIKESLPFAVISIINVLYANMIIILLRLYTNDLQVGVFSAAQKLIGFLFIIPQMLMNAIFPSFTSVYKESLEKMGLMYITLFRIILIFSLPFTAFVIIYAKDIIYLIYGKNYLHSIVPFQILSFTLLNSVGYVNGAALNAIGLEKYYSKIFGITTVLTALLGFIFIPKFSLVAASLILLFASFAGLIIYSYKLFTHLNLTFPFATLVKSIKISILLTFSIAFVKMIINFLLLQLLISVLIWISLIYLVKPFESSDIYLIKLLLPTKLSRMSNILIGYLNRHFN